jgi:hypothetical protein
MKTTATALYIFSLTLLALTAWLGYWTWELPVEVPPTFHQKPKALAPKASTAAAPADPSAQEIDQFWSTSLRRPLEDPPPAAPPPPPPPPPPPISVSIVGMVQEKSRDYALLEVASAGTLLVKAGDIINAQGAEIRVMEITGSQVVLAIGTQRLVVERKP